MGLICSAEKVISYLVSLSNNKGATIYRIKKVISADKVPNKILLSNNKGATIYRM